MTCKAVCLVALFTAGCSSSAGPTFDSADQDRIKAVIQQLTEAFNAKDAAKAAALYTSEAVVMPPNKTLMRGRNFVEQYYTGRFGEGATNLELQPNEIKGSGTLAVAMGDYRLVLAPPSGPPWPPGWWPRTPSSASGEAGGWCAFPIGTGLPRTGRSSGRCSVSACRPAFRAS